MFKPGAEATHPELLEALASQLTAADFDLKLLVRAVCNSRAYQRSSKSVKGNERDSLYYGRMPVKVMTAEQLWDSLVLVFGREPVKLPNVLWETRAIAALRGGEPRTPRGQFVRYFQGEKGVAPTEYTQGIPHALRLMNGVQFNDIEDVLDRLAPKDATTADVIEALYLAMLSRRPSVEESAHMSDYVKGQKSRRDACADILWALLKSSEFVMNH
jgi:hypothetical protein